MDANLQQRLQQRLAELERLAADDYERFERDGHHDEYRDLLDRWYAEQRLAERAGSRRAHLDPGEFD
jgi:hypothetical protein